jgi:hypothetical protein
MANRPDQRPAELPGPRGPAIPARPSTGQVITTAWGQAVHDAAFGNGVWYDVRDGWQIDNIAAGVADGTSMPRFGSTNLVAYSSAPLAGLAGRLVGMFYRANGVPSAGAIRVQARCGGSSPPELITYTVGSPNTGVVMFATQLGFVATSSLSVLYGSDAGLVPVTVDLGIGLIVAYNYIP